VNDPSAGLLDTNVFLHAHATDEFTEECRGFLAALEQGSLRAHLEPIILHEISYALPRYIKQMTRDDIAAYLLMVLSWPGVQGEKDAMVDTVDRWWRTPGLAFADAYLAALAVRRACVVYTKNISELVGQGVPVPQPLPSGPTLPPRGPRPTLRRGSRRGSD
jgi:predicted nucleic acid-binding protein